MVSPIVDHKHMHKLLSLSEKKYMQEGRTFLFLDPMKSIKILPLWCTSEDRNKPPGEVNKLGANRILLFNNLHLLEHLKQVCIRTQTVHGLYRYTPRLGTTDISNILIYDLMWNGPIVPPSVLCDTSTSYLSSIIFSGFITRSGLGFQCSIPEPTVVCGLHTTPPLIHCMQHINLGGGERGVDALSTDSHET